MSILRSRNPIVPSSIPRAPDTTLRVAYVLKMFPRLSETFILNELLELERRGVELSIFSLMYPADGKFHGRLGQLRCAAEYLPREKLESYWERVQASDPALVPPFARWEEALEFLFRRRMPKDLDLLLRSLAIAVEVKRRGIQHLHAHFATIATRVAALVHFLTGVPFSFTSHAKDIFRETVDFDLYAELLDRAAFNVTVTEFNRNHLAERLGAGVAGKIRRVYNGIDLDYFSPDRGCRVGTEPHIVSVGRLVPKKGFDDLLHALRLLLDRGQTLRATFVGDGECEADLRSRCQELGLAAHVTFAGALAQEDARDVLAGATLTVLACRPDADGNMDALPTVLLESLAVDVPLVSTRLSGIPEIVHPSVGTLAAPEDPASLAQAIEQALARVVAGDFEGGVCRRRAEELFDLRRSAGELCGHFRASAAASAAP